MVKLITAEEAVSMVDEGSSILFGGFLAVGATENLIDALVEKGTKNLHLAAICTDYPDRGCGKLIANKQVKSVQSSHIGTNKATQEQYNTGELEVEFIPQGTFMERIRAAGAGLGGILTPTGLGTMVEKGKDIITVKGDKFLLEEPIFGDFAFIRAKKADKFGNLVFEKTARNSNPIMITAAKTTFVEVDEILEVGEISPEDVHSPGIFTDYLIVHK
ncbi:MAG: CoA transferase subunit A [Spirochaetota bacterium]